MLGNAGYVKSSIIQDNVVTSYDPATMTPSSPEMNKIASGTCLYDLRGQVNQLQGIQGITGQVGSGALQGATGLQGIQGIQGTTGLTGLQGLQGIQGLDGKAGNLGSDLLGPTGIQGVQGIQGIDQNTTSDRILEVLSSVFHMTVESGTIAFTIPLTVVSDVHSLNGFYQD